jgi:hypothetical protein
MVKRKSTQSGAGFFSNIASGLSKANDVLRQTKILSTVGSLIPIPGVQAAARIGGMLGYGRKHGYKHKPGPKKGAKKPKSQGGKGRKKKPLVS